MSGERPNISELLCADNCCLVLIDLQERLLPVIRQGETVLAVCQFLRQAAAIFSVPTLLTEQYPKGLGPVVPALLDGAEDLPRMSKLRFSAAREVLQFLEEQNGVRSVPLTQVCLAGIETHVCVLQTALELRARVCRCLLQRTGREVVLRLIGHRDCSGCRQPGCRWWRRNLRHLSGVVRLNIRDSGS